MSGYVYTSAPGGRGSHPGRVGPQPYDAQTWALEHWDAVVACMYLIISSYAMLVLYRVYRHRARRRYIRTAIRQQQPEPVPVTDWQTYIWSQCCLVRDKSQSKLLAVESAVTSHVLAVWSKVGKPVLKGLVALSVLPFMGLHLFIITSEWLKIWAGMDREAKVESISSGIGHACNAFVRMMDAASEATRQFLFTGIVFSIKAAFASVRFVVVTTFDVVKFAVEALWSGLALLSKLVWGVCCFVGRQLGSVFISGVGFSYQPVARGFNHSIAYLGQVSVLAAHWTKGLFTKLRPKKQQWHQQHDTELLASIKQDSQSKKGNPRKAPRGKQHPKHKQQLQRKGGPAAVPSPSAGPTKRGGVGDPTLSVSATAQPEAVFTAAAVPAGDSGAASPPIGAKSMGDFPAMLGADSPANMKLPVDEVAGNVSPDVQSEAGSNAGADLLKNDSFHADVASDRADSPARTDSSLHVKTIASLPSKAAQSQEKAVNTPRSPSVSPTKATISPAKSSVSPAQPDITKSETIQAGNHTSAKPSSKTSPKLASLLPGSVTSQQDTASAGEAQGTVPPPQPHGQLPEPQAAGPLPAPPKPKRRTPAVHKPKVAVTPAGPKPKGVATPADPKPVEGSAAGPRGLPAQPLASNQALLSSLSEPGPVSHPAQAVVHGEVFESLEQMVFGDDDIDAEQQNMCIVCWTMERETTLAPCGHRVLCRGCTKALMSARKKGSECLCPICRTEVESYILKQYDA